VRQRDNGLLRVAQGVLLTLAVLSLLGAVAGLLGSGGTRTIFDRHVPRVVAEQVQRLWPQSGEMPSSLVLIEPSHREDSYETFNEMPTQGGEMPQGWAQLRDERTDVVGGAGELLFADPSMLQRLIWLIGITLIPVGLAVLWWILSRIVASARHGDPFTNRNARRLATAGVLVMAGPALAILIQQVAVRSMLTDSTAADKADIWFQWESAPWWTLGVGLALLVLAAVWRQGVALREDVEGLV
jgi:hypothetical protein